MNDPLPMIVWLAGDDPHFNDFSLDADAVMERLGIKRTRLTQISGRELRVGRAKQDRYIKPFYRPEDVDAYLNWTKATSTSKKSSELVQEAAILLAQESSQLKESFAEPLSQASEQMSSQIKELTAVFISHMEEAVARRLRKIEDDFKKQTDEQKHHRTQVELTSQKLLEALDVKKDVGRILPELAYVHKEMISRLSILENEMGELKKDFQRSLEEKQTKFKKGISPRNRVKVQNQAEPLFKKFPRRSHHV